MEFIAMELHGPRGRGVFTLVDGDYDGEYFSQWRWYLGKNGYVSRTDHDTNRIIYLHHEVCRPMPGFVVGHKNGNKLDNRSCNLHHTTMMHAALRRPKRKNKYGFTGISPSVRKAGGWNAYHMVDGKSKYLGTFNTKEEAARAWDEAAIKEYGEFARLNFPRDLEK